MYVFVEIYYVVYGRYEIYVFIKIFMLFSFNGELYIVVSYICIFLVIFLMSEVKVGKYIKGCIVVELGNWNIFLDIIYIEKDGVFYFLMNNIFWLVMKIVVDEVVVYKDFLIELVKGNFMIVGVDYILLFYVNVL